MRSSGFPFTSPGTSVKAWAYNEQVPGPQIRVREGDRVRMVVKNNLPESTAVHFHGVELPNDQDGVPYITQPPIKPGASFTYEFTVPNSGSHMYHSHHNSAKQVGMGLLDAFIVEPKAPRAVERSDVDHVLILNDGSHGYTFNGKGFPATEPIVAKLGQKVRIRFMNEGMMIHPMHLHGMHMTVIDKDGWAVPSPWKCDTLNIAPGERWDVIVNCTNPGTSTDAATRDRLESIREMAAATMEELRALAASMYPQLLDDLGVEAAIEQLGRIARERYHCPVSTAFDIGERLPADVSSVVYTVVQEAISVATHGNATRIRVAVAARGGRVEVVVHHDGDARPGDAESAGAFAVRQRVALAEGRYELQSTPELGTRIAASIPIVTPSVTDE